ncbi:thymidylate synthase [Rhizobium phage RHEph22]|uniref:thymidylate synthase n=1 Tax=Rhizobium phage RHEph22 TaxID=2836135 RepID=A0AAE7VMX5_9CAUD|nr:thymidylate synthase [Rhizobium phage RHEph22]QXV74727.1 thymidylate synthase protein [Rhizobium phage RHEph22]QXV74822.1 thymidylate synthase protein [Rhizobium phage RHEph24]
MKQYLDLINLVLHQGTKKGDRTGTGTIDYFSPPSIEVHLGDGFPLLTTKKLPFRLIAEETLWFLAGSTNNNDLVAKDVHIWDEWADPITGSLGPIYGHQWRRCEGVDVEGNAVEVDQIQNLVNDLRNNPESRRLIVDSWDVVNLKHMALTPCHCLFQCNVTNGQLDLKMYQRSADLFLGVPFNIASYALLTHMLAQVAGLEPGRLIISYGSAHIYLNHVEQIKEQLTRTPLPLPKLVLDDSVKEINDFTMESFRLEGYQSHARIQGDVSV